MAHLSTLAGRRWDALVVGAGPGGAFSAYGLARRGLSVLLVDRATFPRDKVCGCCVNPQALAVLCRAGLGELLDECGAVPLTAFHVAAGRRRAAVPIAGWAAVSRPRLDAALAAAAVEAGAGFLDGVTVAAAAAGRETMTVRLHAGAEEVGIEVGFVVAADGLAGAMTRRAAAVGLCVEAASRIGAGVTVFDSSGDYEPSNIYMACGPGGYVGLVRLEDGRLNLAAALDADFMRQYGGPGAAAARILAGVGWPAVRDLADRPWRGTAALTRTTRRPGAGRLLAVGDAAGYVEPFTGEGMAWALAGGEALAELAAGGWWPGLDAAWTRWCRTTAPRRQRLIRAVAGALRRPVLTGCAVAALHRFPSAAGWLIDQLFAAAPPRPPCPGRSPAPPTGRASEVPSAASE